MYINNTNAARPFASVADKHKAHKRKRGQAGMPLYAEEANEDNRRRR